MTRLDDRYDLLCEEVRDALSGALDPAAVDPNADAVSRHLQHCAACTAYQRELLELDAVLQSETDVPVDQTRLWARVASAIGSGDTAEQSAAPTASSPMVMSRRSVLWWSGAAAASVAIAVPLASVHWLGESDQDSAFMTGIADDFRAYRESGKHLDVETTHPAILHGWMAARVEFDLPEDVTGPPGVQLAGGRLCSILGEKLAFFAYNAPVGPVGLYVTPASDLAVMENDRITATSLDEGLTTISWRRGGLGYVVVAAASIGNLDPFVQHFRETAA